MPLLPIRLTFIKIEFNIKIINDEVTGIIMNIPAGIQLSPGEMQSIL